MRVGMARIKWQFQRTAVQPHYLRVGAEEATPVPVGHCIAFLLAHSLAFIITSTVAVGVI
jgi:hypothetical protein